MKFGAANPGMDGLVAQVCPVPVPHLPECRGVETGWHLNEELSGLPPAKKKTDKNESFEIFEKASFLVIPAKAGI